LPNFDADLPPSSRPADGPAFGALAQAMLTSPERARLIRAVGQYQYALGHFAPGRETFALSHLWMAVEALTRVIRNIALEEAGSRELLLEAWGIELKDLDPEVRRRVIFCGDIESYSETKRVSDGFEHGYLDPGTIHDYARKRFIKVAEYVREATIRAAFSPQSVPAELTAEELRYPLGASPVRRYVRGTLIGPGDELAPGGGGFPGFRIDSTSVETRRSPRGHIDIEPLDALRFMAGGQTQASDVKFQLWGPSASPTAAIDRIDLRRFAVQNIRRASEQPRS
jgi:hypothetical protein